jgi:hypothetical protein
VGIPVPVLGGSVINEQSHFLVEVLYSQSIVDPSENHTAQSVLVELQLYFVTSGVTAEMKQVNEKYDQIIYAMSKNPILSKVRADVLKRKIKKK